ncbi:MAG: 1-deoxy-D-xylulose-5-phosphate reductoisomerase [Gemmatimonadetes bacterium]|nr:1-deoxy-D-xylulose-5-phosphate reductoisomerase [Gemmatimonadota bacterium]
MAVGIALLGSTGSIGKSALAVVERHPERFRLVVLAAHRNGGELLVQSARHRPALAVLADPEMRLQAAPPPGVELRIGREALLDAARHPGADVVINAVVGAAGLEASLAALGAGKRLALANKESLVAGGPLVLQALRRGKGELVPIDSEHSAILQCLASRRRAVPDAGEVRRLILTASGGPFRERDRGALLDVTPAEALRHPTWDMGAKVTVDSATLANKALEVIEAHFLFGVPYDRLEVVIHPQSVVHSLVEFVDGSVLAQLGFPTMELPILYALSYPDRIPDGRARFDPVAASPLTFEPLDAQRFPAFRLGLQAARAGGTAPAAFNAANEVAVAGFLAENLPFPRIAEVIEGALAAHRPAPADSLEAVLEADRCARAVARQMVERT